MNIRLQSVLQSQEGWGQQQGRLARARLEALIAPSPLEQVIKISLVGITRTDVPFARSAVVELAMYERLRRGFCLIEVSDVDILDNWDAAAERSQQPLLVWFPDGSFRLLGPQPSIGVRTTLDYLLAHSSVCSHEVARALRLSLSNASNKLNFLLQAGYVLRRERINSDGRKEYEYFRIG